MTTVMEMERGLGYEPRDVHKENLGYDIESSIPATGKLRFIEVKGRAKVQISYQSQRTKS